MSLNELRLIDSQIEINDSDMVNLDKVCMYVYITGGAKFECYWNAWKKEKLKEESRG